MVERVFVRRVKTPPDGVNGCAVADPLCDGQFEPERRSASFDTLDSNRPSHRFHESLADRKTQSGAAVLPGCRAVRLLKWLKKSGGLGWSESDACVFHLKPDTRLRFELQDA